MSVRKRPDLSPYYQYEFQLKGRRFFGSTGETSKPKAIAFENRRKQEAKQEAVEKSLAILTMNEAAGLFYTQKIEGTDSESSEFGRLSHLTRIIGKATLLHKITSATLANYVTIRQSETTKYGKPLENATINREIQLFRRLNRRAGSIWKTKICTDIDFGELLLSEPDGRVRELHDDEEVLLFNALRADYHPVIMFLLLTGLRRSNGVLLQKRQVNWTARTFTIHQKSRKKRGAVHTIPLTEEIAILLKREWMNHPTAVFTYECQRSTRDKTKGERLPMTVAGFKTTMQRAVEKAGLEDFTVHDLRHTAATRLTRENGNLLITQKLLGHSSPVTTARYSHVLLDDVRTAMERVSEAKTPTNHGKKPGKFIKGM